MDGDELLQYLGLGLAGIAAVMVLAAIVGRIGSRLCRLVGLPAWPGALAGTLFPLAVLLGSSLYLDQAGVVVPARVLAKEERIFSARNRAPDNWWTRQLQMTVEFATVDGRPTTTQVLVDEERFDALRPGAAVMVRYLPEVRLVARLADQSTWVFVSGAWLAPIGLFVAVLATLWLMVRLHAPMPLTVIVAIAGLFGLLTLLFPPWEPDLGGPPQSGTAEVRNVRTITRSAFWRRRRGSRWEAPQPWQLVELVFVPAGRDQPVVAVDGVDSGSVAGLAVGARVPITYAVEAPRSAQLAGGARTYRMAEWTSLAEAVAIGAAVLGGLWLLGKGWGRLMRRAASRRTDDAI